MLHPHHKFKLLNEMNFFHKLEEIEEAQIDVMLYYGIIN